MTFHYKFVYQVVPEQQYLSLFQAIGRTVFNVDQKSI